MKKAEIAKKIDSLFTKHLGGELGDYRIFYSNKAIDVDTSKGKNILKDIKSTDYSEYGRDDTVTVTFDGSIYTLMNYDPKFNLVNALTELLEKYNCWWECGHAWNFNVYEDE
jgi:hypothetical protein